MKTVGVVLLVLGGLTIISGFKVAATKYNFSNSHDLSKFCGGLGISVAILAVGLYLVLRKPKADEKPPAEKQSGNQ